MGDVPLSSPTDQAYGAAYGSSGDSKEPDFGNGAGGRSRARNTMSLTMSTISHLIVISFTIYIVMLCFFDHYSLFLWHPSLMTLGAFLLMGEAVMAMSQDNFFSGKLGRPSRVQMHWVLQALAAALIFIGFLIIVVNKNTYNKPHFHTWHAIFGLITVIMVGMTSSGGVAALYSINLKQIIKPALMKLIHNIAGILTYTCGAFCMILAMYSGWITKKTSSTTQVFCVIAIIVAAACTLESAVRSAYARIKQTFENH